MTESLLFTGTNAPTEPWSVSGLSMALKRTIEGQFNHVRVQGELGRVTKHSSGHMYFDLKDADALIHAAWFKGAQRKVEFALEQGLEVIVTGKLSSYPARSEYQLIVTHVEVAGVGALLKLIEDRKKKLAAEGLFDTAKKRKIPYLPRTIGIITSPTGAVIHDMIHRLSDRFLPHVLVWPVAVQGDAAAGQVLAALQGFQALPPTIPTPDVIIIARGGGSVEDLMPFNDEALVRAVAASRIPIISAIGHETDWTLIDLAADLRAPTPTGAAELVVPVKAELLLKINALQQSLQAAPVRLLHYARRALPDIRPPRNLLDYAAQRLDSASTRLDAALKLALQQRTLRLIQLSLPSLSVPIQKKRAGLTAMAQRLQQVMERHVHTRRLKLAQLTPRAPHNLVAQQRQKIAFLNNRFAHMGGQLGVMPRQRLDALSATLEAYSYTNTLKRGFALVRSADGSPILSAPQATAEMQLQFSDGVVRVKLN